MFMLCTASAIQWMNADLSKLSNVASQQGGEATTGVRGDETYGSIRDFAAFGPRSQELLAAQEWGVWRE